MFTKKTCDTTIDLSTDPPGLVVREAVFAPGDAHCCPSSTKTSVLTFDEATGLDRRLDDRTADLTRSRFDSSVAAPAIFNRTVE